jgi:GT2 family glycosyltransferase
MNIDELVTAVLFTYNTPDFTKSCIASFRRWFKGEVVLFNGSSSSGILDIPDVTIINRPGSEWIERINLLPKYVKTKYALLMDTDTKMTRNCIPEIVELLESDEKIGMTAAYACKSVDKERHQMAFSTVFNGHMEVEGFIGWFSLIRVQAFIDAEGLKVEKYYDEPDEILKHGSRLDLTFCKRMIDKGWKLITPSKSLDVIHWLHASGGFDDSVFSEWCRNNSDHRKCDPLNNWESIDWSKKY